MDTQNRPNNNEEIQNPSPKKSPLPPITSLDPEEKRQAGASAVAAEEDRLQRALQDRLDNQAQASMTGFLDTNRDMLPQITSARFGIRNDDTTDYTILPERMQRIEIPDDTPLWYIELRNLGKANQSVGLIIAGDVILGRGSGAEDSADFDIEQYAHPDDGISRRHVMFRPSESCLYLLDVGSTNGSMLNGLPITRSQIRALSDNDTITLGKFSFTLKITGKPGDLA